MNISYPLISIDEKNKYPKKLPFKMKHEDAFEHWDKPFTVIFNL